VLALTRAGAYAAAAHAGALAQGWLPGGGSAPAVPIAVSDSYPPLEGRRTAAAAARSRSVWDGEDASAPRRSAWADDRTQPVLVGAGAGMSGASSGRDPSDPDPTTGAWPDADRWPPADSGDEWPESGPYDDPWAQPGPPGSDDGRGAHATSDPWQGGPATDAWGQPLVGPSQGWDQRPPAEDWAEGWDPPANGAWSGEPAGQPVPGGDAWAGANSGWPDAPAGAGDDAWADAGAGWSATEPAPGWADPSAAAGMLPAPEGYGNAGYDEAGYASAGYPSEGYESSGYDSPGYDSPAYDTPRYDHAGYQALPAVDPETGLWTAKFLRDRLSSERARSRRSGQPFSLVLVQVPDGPLAQLPYRRQVTLLRELGYQFVAGGVVDHLVHVPDDAQHWFAVILPDTDRSGAHVLERRLRLGIGGYLSSRGLPLRDLESASLTAPDDDPAMAEIWEALIGPEDDDRGPMSYGY
jgi:hypothetical protein